MSCPECEALHAKIRTYESLLGTPEEAQLHRLRQAFGFSQNEAATLMSLVNANGIPISVHVTASTLSSTYHLERILSEWYWSVFPGQDMILKEGKQ